MCQYSLGGTKIARGAEVQSLRLAECRAESERQWGCVGGLQKERQIRQAGLGSVVVWGAVRLPEETKGGVWQREPAKSWLVPGER